MTTNTDFSVASQSLAQIMKARDQAFQMFNQFEFLINQDKYQKHDLIECMHQIWSLPPHIYNQFLIRVAIYSDASYSEVKTKFNEWKEEVQEDEIQKIIRQAEAQQDLIDQEAEWKLIESDLDAIKPFLNTINTEKAFIGSSYSPYRIGLTLWQDPRVPITIKIPQQIRRAVVEIEWVTCQVPPIQVFQVNMSDWKPNQTKKFSWLEIRNHETLGGFMKIFTVYSRKYTKEFDGTTLRIKTQKKYNPHAMENLVLCLSSFPVPVWVRNVVVTCEYIDPLA